MLNLIKKAYDNVNDALDTTAKVAWQVEALAQEAREEAELKAWCIENDIEYFEDLD